ncbi:hypothetical protein ABW21_db0206781 [Orbilia brochopaga]|nr:hypothetical protein ABW21_db0206781 [Drechslerella brochopaga]
MASATTATGPSEVFSANATLNGGNPAAATANTSAGEGSTTSPEEIAWYFVESYYTTLNRTPERLHLFHQKKSSFIWGTEGDNVPVSRGRNEILERIKDLGFKDCKVRVTNVDSQASLASGIIVQVLGDMTNNAEPSKRFSQTFFLAEQTNPQGYYVLNDIFRYLRDEEEEEVLEPAAEEPVPEAAPEPVAEEVTVPEEKEPEVEAVPEPEEPAPTPAVEEEEVKEEKPVEEAEKVEEPVVEPEAEKTEEPITAPVVPVVPAVPAVPAVPVAQAEPAEPEPATQTVVEPTKIENQPPAPAPAPVPQEPPKPAKPSSWAALLAPKTTPAAAPAPAQQAAAPAPAPAPVASTPAAQTASTTPSAQANNNSGWQTTESRRQNRPVSISGAPEAQASAYVRSTTGKITVTHEQLKSALSVYGSIHRVDIVNEKKHAFVDFAEASSLHAAAAANPHRIGDQTIFVEERRPPRPGNYSGPNRGGSSFRGGERQGSRGAQRGPGDRDRFDQSRNSIGGGRGQGGPIRGGGGQFQRGGRGMGAGAASSN